MAPDSGSGGEGEPEMVVGVGASAGGLQALRAFVGSVGDTRLAFVVLQHLKPDVRSYLVDLLARDTSLAVRPVEPGLPVEPGVVYICPPGRSVVVDQGCFRVDQARVLDRQYRPIDVLFSSLAEAYGPRSVGVILSGTGNDGTRGIRAISEAGGVTIAQAPQSAQFEDMPRNAVATGRVDYVVAPDDMAALIGEAEASRSDSRSMTRLSALLLARTGLDVRGYKTGTLRRRIERRIAMLGVDSMRDYVQRVSRDKQELDRLAEAVLIGVTAFFRDERAWRALDRHLPALLESVPPTESLRVWCVGCSTGEEAYSLVFSLRAAMDRVGTYRDLRVFATDANAAAIERASAGAFSDAALASFSDEQRARWFVQDRGAFRVRPELRRCIVFAQHEAIADPPFTRLHLAVCRNLLIYLEPSHQRIVLERLGRALSTNGLLFLGTSESADALGHHVVALDAGARLYRKVLQGPALSSPARLPTLPTSIAGGGRLRGRLDGIYASVAEALGACIFVFDDQRHVLYSTGPTHRVTRLRAGVTSLSIADLLVPPIANLIGRMLLTRGDAPVVVREPRLEAIGVRAVHLTPARQADRVTEARPAVLRIDLEPEGEPRVIGLAADSSDTIAGLRDELAFTQQNLQAINEELVTSNEELQATNEELIASNEELHATNEELHSVNAEFELKLQELTDAKADLDHVIDATQVGVLFLDAALHIRRYTGHAEQWFGLMPQDIGRPFTYFRFPMVDGMDDALKAASEHRRSSLLESPDGQFMVRLLPFEAEGPAAGVVVVVTDATGHYNQLRYRSTAFDALPYAVALVDTRGIVVEVNRAWTTFSVENGGPAGGFKGASYIEACRSADASTEARAVQQGLGELLEGQRPIFQLVYPCHAPTRQRWFLMHAARLPDELGVVVTHIDITSIELRGHADE